MIAVICPICDGDGVIGYGTPCHGCPDNGRGEGKGQGWVEVHEEPEHSYPMTLPDLYPNATVIPLVPLFEHTTP